MKKHGRETLSLMGAMSHGPALDPFTGPNIARISASPFVCFIESGDAGEGGESAGAPPADEMVPKSVMLGRLKQESQKRSALEKQLAELNGKVSEFSTLQERLQQMEEERTLAGKSAEEKAAAAYQRELDKIRREAEGLKGTIAEREKAIAATQETLRTERAMRQIGDVLAAEKAVNASRAARYAMADITIEHNDEGAMVATYGDREGISVSEAVKAWLKDNDNFLPSPGGGAGTQRPSGSGGRPLHELSASELQKMARRRR